MVSSFDRDQTLLLKDEARLGSSVGLRSGVAGRKLSADFERLRRCCSVNFFHGLLLPLGWYNWSRSSTLTLHEGSTPKSERPSGIRMDRTGALLLGSPHLN